MVVHRKEESRMFNQDLLSLLGIVVDCEARSPQKIYCSIVDETGGLYLFLWPAQLVCSQGMLIGFGGWENG